MKCLRACKTTRFHLPAPGGPRLGLRAVNYCDSTRDPTALAMFHLNSDLYDAIDSSAFGTIPILPQRLGWTQVAHSIS